MIKENLHKSQKKILNLSMKKKSSSEKKEEDKIGGKMVFIIKK